ncbi:MAG TPA: hypothetical protein VEH03_03365 [Burkholderiales bacterium]|nr:hypothetical protein [Burkholderiales bacterium]
MVPRSAAYLALLAVLPAAAAMAQLRVPPIPVDSHRGVIRHIGEMAVAIDDRPTLLAAGAQIRDQQNLIIVPTAIPQGGAWADYVVNGEGQVFRVWLLSPAELAVPKPGTEGR